MPRRNRRSDSSRSEELIKAVGAFLVLISLAVGGVKGFLPVLVLLIAFLLVTAAVLGATWVAWKILQHRGANTAVQSTAPANSLSPAVPDPELHAWTVAEIATAFEGLDWYQFEKVNAAILQLEGWSVQRRGGASPDGGVDLIAERAG